MWGWGVPWCRICPREAVTDMRTGINTTQPLSVRVPGSIPSMGEPLWSTAPTIRPSKGWAKGWQPFRSVLWTDVLKQSPTNPFPSSVSSGIPNAWMRGGPRSAGSWFCPIFPLWFRLLGYQAQGSFRFGDHFLFHIAAGHLEQ